MANATDQRLDSTFALLDNSYQLDLRQLISADVYHLLHRLSDFHMYDALALLIHLLGLTSHYLTASSFVYADNQLRHKLNLHLLLIARDGYERSSLVEHIKQAMNNVQSIRQTGKPLDIRHRFSSNVFCQSDDCLPLSNGFCISERFDKHGTSAHIQRQQSSSMIGTSNGHFIREFLSKRTSNHPIDCLMIFLASQPRLFCQRERIFDIHQYPSLEHWIILINGLCSNAIDFFFEHTQANQLMCEYLDALSLQAKSMENSHTSIASKCLAAREHVLRVSAALCVIQMVGEMLFVHRQTYHTFGPANKTFFDNSSRLIEQSRAIYLVNMSLKQFKLMFEPSLTNRITHHDHSTVCDDSHLIRPFSSSASSAKRLKTIGNSTSLKSLELAHELLLLPFVAFTRTSVYTNSKIKRYAVYLDFVLEQLKKYQLIIMVRRGAQMIDGTRRRVDLLVKRVPVLIDNETIDSDLIARLNHFSVDYDQYIQTLGTLDIGEKYRLSDQCFDLFNSSAYQRYLTIDLERFAPLHRLQAEDDDDDDDDDNDLWNSFSSSLSSLNTKTESENCSLAN